jgi:succinate dehydrogenase / fumarate reductase iron-sulfur subunit
MNINGRNGLACLANMHDLPEHIIVRPLPGLPVVGDLVVDMTQFFTQYHSVKPWLINRDPPPERERLRTPKERDELDGLYECILCARCCTACPSFWWNADRFVGPAGLLQAYRFNRKCRGVGQAAGLLALRASGHAVRNRRQHRRRRYPGSFATLKRRLVAEAQGARSDCNHETNE